MPSKVIDDVLVLLDVVFSIIELFELVDELFELAVLRELDDLSKIDDELEFELRVLLELDELELGELCDDNDLELEEFDE